MVPAPGTAPPVSPQSSIDESPDSEEDSLQEEDVLDIHPGEEEMETSFYEDVPKAPAEGSAVGPVQQVEEEPGWDDVSGHSSSSPSLRAEILKILVPYLCSPPVGPVRQARSSMLQSN